MKNVYVDGVRINPDGIGENLLFARLTPTDRLLEATNPDLAIRYALQERKPWVYLSGPIAAATEGQVEKNREAFRHVAKVLREAGINVVSPLEINPPCLGRDRHTCLRNDIAALTQCDEIALLDNWAGSSGVKVEMQVAEAIGLRIWPNWRNLLGPNWRNLLDEGA